MSNRMMIALAVAVVIVLIAFAMTLLFFQLIEGWM